MKVDLEHIFSPEQLFGYFCFVFALFSVSIKDERKMRIMMTIGTVFIGIHFYTMGSLVTATIMFISVVRNFISIYHRSVWVGLIFIAIYIVSGLYTMESALGLIPICGAVINTTAVSMMTGVKMRIVGLSSSLLGVTNSIIVGTIGGAALDAAILITGSITVMRILRDEKKQKLATLV